MPDYLAILILILVAVIGLAIYWLSMDAAAMQQEEDEIEQWLTNGEQHGK